MRNTILNRVINFVRDIDPMAWATVAGVCIFVLVVWAFSTLFFAAADFLNDLDNDRNARQKVYTEAIADVKRDCRLVEKIIQPHLITYTYSCDGVEYQFEETL